jgi:hypothetical protein
MPDADDSRRLPEEPSSAQGAPERDLRPPAQARVGTLKAAQPNARTPERAKRLIRALRVRQRELELLNRSSRKPCIGSCSTI